MRKLILLTLVVVIYSSCSNNKYETQISKMQQEIDSLESEIEMYKNSPEKLLSEAQESYNKKDIIGLKNTHAKLKKYAIESNEYKSVNEWVTLLEKEETDRIALAEKQRKDSLERIEKEKLASVSKLKKEYDDVKAISWYYPKSFTHYTNSNMTSLYIGKTSSNTWLRLKMSYTGDDWIFFEEAYLSYDGNTINIPFDKYREKESDNDSGVWEWIDVAPNEEIIAFLRKMVTGKSIKMRLSGKYTKTRNLSAKEVEAIKNALLAYDVLKDN